MAKSRSRKPAAPPAADPPVASAADADRRIADLDAELKARDARIVELEAELAARDARIAELDEQLAAASAAADQADAQRVEPVEISSVEDADLVEVEYQGGAVSLGTDESDPSSGEVIHSDEDVYNAIDRWNGDQPVSARPGETIRVSPQLAAQLAADHGKAFS